MKIEICIVILIASVSIELHSASSGSAVELLVKWNDGPESYAAAVGNALIGSTLKRNFNMIGWQDLQLPEGMSVSDGIEAYRQLGTVMAVEQNATVGINPPPEGRAVPNSRGEDRDVAPDVGAVETPRPAIGLHGPLAQPPAIPNDPRFRQQWNLRRIGATNAWITTTGSAEVVVAILSDGVNYNHEDLRDNMWRNPGETGLDANGNDRATNGIDDDGNGYVDDVYAIDTGNHDSDPNALAPVLGARASSARSPIMEKAWLASTGACR
jgi:subtilisin family serine protease